MIADGGDADLEALYLEVRQLESQELGRRVAEEVMGWRLVNDRIAETWVDQSGEMTGYYNGRPFSPYRDRNALIEVWRRIESVHLRDSYLRHLVAFVPVESDGKAPDFWTVHTCDADRSCRAALMAVRKPI